MSYNINYIVIHYLCCYGNHYHQYTCIYCSDDLQNVQCNHSQNWHNQNKLWIDATMLPVSSVADDTTESTRGQSSETYQTKQVKRLQKTQLVLKVVTVSDFLVYNVNYKKNKNKNLIEWDGSWLCKLKLYFQLLLYQLGILFYIVD